MNKKPYNEESTNKGKIYTPESWEKDHDSKAIAYIRGFTYVKLSTGTHKIDVVRDVTKKSMIRPIYTKL